MASRTLYLAVLSGFICKFLSGISVGWSSPTIILLKSNNTSPVTLDDRQAALVISLMKLGAIFGCFIAVFTVDIFGRRNTLLLAALPSVVGWLLIGLFNSVTLLYIARIAIGLGDGIYIGILPMYLAEIAPAYLRGRMELWSFFLLNLGIIFSLAVAPFISIQLFAYIISAFTLFFFITFVWSPESPYYLMRRYGVEPAQDSLKKLRYKGGNIEEELESIKNTATTNNVNTFKLRQFFTFATSKNNRRIIFLTLGLVVIFVLSAEILIMNNAETLFRAVKNDYVEEKYLSIILAVVQAITTLISSTLIDRIGRRPLLIVSSIGVSVTSFIVGYYFYAQSNKYFLGNASWLGVLGLISIVLFGTVGLTTVPFVLISEIYPMHIKAFGMNASLAIQYLGAFIELSTFPSIVSIIGYSGAFWVLAVVNVFSFVFVYYCAPETKCKNLEDISKDFELKS